MKYQTVLDRKYALCAKVQREREEGNCVIAKSDNYHKLVTLGECIESGEALTNLIIVKTDYMNILWMSKGCTIPPDSNYGSEITRWMLGDAAFPAL